MAERFKLRDKAKGAERRVRIVTGLIGVVLALAAGWLALSRTGGNLVTLSYDIPYLARGGEVDGVVIVYLDELDGDTLDRRNQAALLDKLNEAGAKAVAYDLVFDRPSEDPEIDIAFAAAMLRFRGVDGNWEPVPGAPQRKVLLACGRETFSKLGAEGERLIPPNDVLLGAADDFGLVALVCDDSYVVRELSAGTPDEPGLAWKAALAHGAKLSESDRNAPRWINYAKPGAILTLNAADLLGDDFSPLLVKDKIVVVGAKPGSLGIALGLDLFSSPFHRFDWSGNKLHLLSGVVIQANTLANLMNGNWLTRSSKGFDNAMIVLAAIIAGLAFSWVRPLRAMLAGAGAVILIVLAAILAMHEADFWFPWAAVAFAQIPVALVWGTGSKFYIERFFRVKLTEEQRMLKEAFEKYLSPQMLEKLTEDGFQMKFGGEKVPCAMMFTDLESFTNMCEKVGDPEKIVEALSGYFERTTGHIFDHEGVVIKFIGDAIFAAWGAPIPDAAAPVKAARAAWHLSQNDHLVVEGVNLKTRIGVHFGEVVAGNIGSRKRVDYTMIGDAVNLSARLEGLNKAFGTRILISEDVRSHLGDEFVTRKVGAFKVKGRKEPTVAHELLGPRADVEVPSWLAVYQEALVALENDDFGNAQRLFAETDAMRGDSGDGPSRFYLPLLARGAEIKGGVFEMSEK
jgi:adenylate cyclase